MRGGGFQNKLLPRWVFMHAELCRLPCGKSGTMVACMPGWAGPHVQGHRRTPLGSRHKHQGGTNRLASCGEAKDRPTLALLFHVQLAVVATKR